jgi:hypothetical protein
MTLIALFLGMAICFNGYRWFLILLPILGFVFGFGIGAQTVTAIFGVGFLSTVTSWVVGFIVALIFAVLSYLFYFIGVALIGGYLGYALGVGFMGLIGLNFGLITWLVGIILGVIFGIATLALNIQKYVIIAFTALAGAGVIVGSFLFVFGVIQPADIALNAVGKAIQDSVFWLIIFLLLAILGVASQLYTSRNFELSPPESQF